MNNITNIPYARGRQIYANDPAENKRADERKKSQTTEKSETAEDKISLSDTSKEIQIAKESADSTPDVRSEKVEQIKQAISEGRYAIDYEQVAEKMIGFMLNGYI